MTHYYIIMDSSKPTNDYLHLNNKITSEPIWIGATGDHKQIQETKRPPSFGHGEMDDFRERFYTLIAKGYKIDLVVVASNNAKDKVVELIGEIGLKMKGDGPLLNKSYGRGLNSRGIHGVVSTPDGKFENAQFAVNGRDTTRQTILGWCRYNYKPITMKCRQIYGDLIAETAITFEDAGFRKDYERCGT